MSKKNNALSEENLGQVSGGTVTLPNGVKLDGKAEDAWLKENGYTKNKKGGKTTPVPPPVDSTANVVESVEPMEPSQGDMINNLFNN